MYRSSRFEHCLATLSNFFPRKRDEFLIIAKVSVALVYSRTDQRAVREFTFRAAAMKGMATAKDIPTVNMVSGLTEQIRR